MDKNEESGKPLKRRVTALVMLEGMGLVPSPV